MNARYFKEYYRDDCRRCEILIMNDGFDTHYILTLFSKGMFSINRVTISFKEYSEILDRCVKLTQEEFEQLEVEWFFVQNKKKYRIII
jgi:hypothetical protein